MIEAARRREVAEEAWARAREARRDEHEQLLDQVALEERRRECRPALEQQRLDALRTERAQLLLGRARAQLQARPGRQRAQPEREPTRLTHDRDVPRVELRVVGAHRAHPDRDRIGLRTQLMHEATCRLARHPPLAGNRHAPVERRGHLVGHERPVVDGPPAPRLRRDACVPVVHHLDLDARRA